MPIREIAQIESHRIISFSACLWTYFKMFMNLQYIVKDQPKFHGLKHVEANVCLIKPNGLYSSITFDDKVTFTDCKYHYI